MYFSNQTELFQHADLWVEAQFSFPNFHSRARVFVEGSDFVGGHF